MPSAFPYGMESFSSPINPADYQDNILEYTQFRTNTCSAVKDADKFYENMAQFIAESAARIGSKSADQLKVTALAGNAEDSLEAGIRVYTGCGAEKHQDLALFYWMRLVDDSTPGFVPNVSRSLRARAYSCLAQLHCDRTGDPNGTWNIDSLHRAAAAANKGAGLGFTSPSILSVGFKVQHAGFRRQEDNRFPDWSTRRFEVLTDLWEVCDKRTAQVEGKKQKRDGKMAANALAYICAAPGCGVEGTRRSALLQCSGPCATHTKPSYCSKECQRRHWKQHKPHCKSGGDSEASGDKHNGITGAIISPEPAEPADSAEVADSAGSSSPDKFSTDGKERLVLMPDPTNPGGTIPLTSKTMSPAYMRDLRESALKLMNDTAGGSPSL